MRIFIGLFLLVGGALMTIYFEKAFQIFGSFDWAERNLGSSRLWYQLLGAFIALFGIMVMFRVHEVILRAIFSPLF